jgi:uncharacterized membrane protein
MGLGYPTLNRYDPRSVPGLYDTRAYGAIVTGEPLQADQTDLAHRILVPYLSRPIYWLANNRVHTWNPVFLALLCVNSLFIATTSLLLVQISDRIVEDGGIALIAGFVYLTNFAVANFNLSGYVDSAINCALVLIAWSLLHERWWLLPFWGILGALAKETAVPLSAAFAIGWWLIGIRKGAVNLSRLAWIGGMVAAGLLTVTLVMSYVSPGMTPLIFAASRRYDSGAEHFYLSGLIRTLVARESFFVFGWLLALGVWKLGRLPRTWVVASVSAAIAALAMGAYDDALGNTVRPLFSALGPLLSLSVAILLPELCGCSRAANDGLHS